MRLVEIADINLLYDLCKDASVRKYNSYHLSLPDKSFIINNFSIIRRVYKKVLSVVNEKGVLIGFMNYETCDEKTLTYMIGITIGQRFWGRGYGKDAILTLVNYLFEEKDANIIQVEVAVPNIRARKCYESCGFINIDINKESLCTADECIDTVNMHLYKSEFIKKNIL